jgi:tetratricopeptide (TPR) repeat protein
MSDMATAYYASTQVVAYIAEHFGMPKVRRMLELWGEGKRTPEVIRTALGSAPEEIDSAFRAALSARLAGYKNQFSPDTHAPDLAVARGAVQSSPRDAEAQARLALSLMAAGEEKQAEAALATALRLDPKQPLGLWLRAQVKKTRGDKAGSRDALLALVAAGHDGYTVRIALAEVAMSPADRRAQLEAARAFDATAAAPLKALVELAHASRDEGAELEALRALTLVEENDGPAYRRLLEILISRRLFDEARKVGEAAVFVDVESAKTHVLYAEALVGAGARREAVFELESAVRCTSDSNDVLIAHSRLSELLAAQGDRAGAAQHKKAASDLAKQQSEQLGPI